MNGILSGLWQIISEDLEVPSALLVRWRLKTFGVVRVYALFAAGKISAEGVYAHLRAGQVGDFIALHDQVKEALAGQGELPPELTIYLTQMFIDNPRRFEFIVPQIDALIQRDIEKNIFRRSGKRNIIKREF